MLRPLATLVLLLAACGPRPGASSPRVEPPPAPLSAPDLLAPGEEMVWDIYWQAVQVGRATFSVGASEARSTFSTTPLARAFAKVAYDLVTTPSSAHEGLAMGGTRRSISLALDGARYSLDGGPYQTAPGGTALHTLHSALGSLRTWSRGDARPAYLWFILRHTLYRLDVERPVRGDAQGRRALEVHAMARAIDSSIDPVEITIWFASTPDRTPLRFVVVANGERVSAELVETNTAVAANSRTLSENGVGPN